MDWRDRYTGLEAIAPGYDEDGEETAVDEGAALMNAEFMRLVGDNMGVRER